MDPFIHARAYRQIEQDTRELALPNGRRVGQPGHGVARQYLLGRLTEIGLESFAGDGFELPYSRAHPVTGMPTEFCNLVGVAPGTERELPPLLIGAHYDSVIDAPCADDNATAVAVALAIADRFRRHPLRRDVVVALFDAEEPPFFLGDAMGSVRFYRDHCSGTDLSCAVIMDLIGHDVELGIPGLDDTDSEVSDLLFVLGSESDGRLPIAVESAARMALDLPVIATLNDYVGDLSDHHAFRLGGEAYVFLSCGQGRYYHQPQDTVEWVNFEKVGRVYRFVAELLLALDGSEPLAGRAPALGDDEQAAFEIRTIDAALGAVLPRLGMELPTSRSELDQLVAMLAGRLLV